MRGSVGGSIHGRRQIYILLAYIREQVALMVHVKLGTDKCRYCGVVLQQGNLPPSFIVHGNRKCTWCWNIEMRSYAVKRSRVLRNQILGHYGPKCACCGETIQEFLTIDHADNNGSLHRKGGKGKGANFYREIIKQGFPPTYRILCYNCNCGRRLGQCPHIKNSTQALGALGQSMNSGTTEVATGTVIPPFVLPPPNGR